MKGRIQNNDNNINRFRDQVIELTKYHAQHNRAMTDVTFLWQRKWSRAWEISRGPDGDQRESLIRQFWRSMPFRQQIESSTPSPMSTTSIPVDAQMPAPCFVAEGGKQKRIIAVRKQGYGRQLLLEHFNPSGPPILELVTSSHLSGLRQLNLRLDSLPQMQLGDHQHLLHRSLDSLRITGVASLRRVIDYHSHKNPMTFVRLAFNDNDQGIGTFYYYSRSILHKYFGKHIIDKRLSDYITTSQTPTRLLGQQRRYSTQGVEARQPRPSHTGTTLDRTHTVPPDDTELNLTSEKFQSFDARLLTIERTVTQVVELLERLGCSR